jgi:muramoyltetrapeptide carboxypeptidase
MTGGSAGRKHPTRNERLASKRKPTAVTPRFLNPGDTVGVVSPGFAVKPALLEQGLDRLRRMGYEVVVGDHVLARQGYLAGDDGQRAADLREMLRRPEVSARAALRRDPKLLIGYSDLTALFNAVVDRTPAVCLYGPVVTELGDSGAWHAPSLRALTSGESLTLRLARRSVLVEGRSEGRLLGGNLSVLTHLVGTRFAPDFRDCILFLEETGEQTYRVDRMLTQLRQSGALRRVKGIVLGRITVPPRRRFPPDRSPDEVLRETFVPLGVPVVRDLPAGHLPGKRTLPLGARAILDTTSRTLSFEP